MTSNIIILVLVSFILTGCPLGNPFKTVSTDNGVSDSDIASPPPRYYQGVDEEEFKQMSARLTNMDKGYYVTGSLDGSGFVDFQNLSFDERNRILMGNTILFPDLIETFGWFYGRYPESWDEFKESPVGRCLVLYNPFTGAPLKFSQDFSPGDIKIFGVDEEGRGIVRFHNWEEPDAEGGGGSLEWVERTTDFMHINFASEDVTVPRTDEEWQYMFICNNLAKYMRMRSGYEFPDPPVNAEDYCYRRFPLHTFVFKFVKPGDDGKAVVLSEEIKPNSLSMFSATESQLLLFKAYGEDSNLIYQTIVMNKEFP
jgi:hypothetical protein